MVDQRRRLVVVAGVLMTAVSACGQPSTAAHSTTNASSTATVAPVDATASPSGSPAVVAATNALGASVSFTCRLPIVTGGQAPQAGFISFPSGAYAPDPAGNTPKTGLAYDRAYGRWLPVDWRSVSDDGSRYTYATYGNNDPLSGTNSIIHIVNVATGADRILLRTGQYIIMDYVGAGIYLAAWIGGHDGPGPQVGWVVDPVSGSVRALSGGQKYGYWIGSGAGWRMDYNTADPTVHTGMTGANRIIRVDLASGAEVTWFYQQGADYVQVEGFDRSGHPIVNSGVGGVSTMWLLTDASHRSKLFTGPTFFYSATADLHGIWFSNGSATYLYNAASGLQEVSLTGGQIAGGCH
jgi:hypothetical protein